MPEIRDYSPLAASNTATPPNGWAIGTVAGLYGGIVRELMARVRRWWSDISGVAVSTGSGGAYAVATAQSNATRVCWFANHANPNAGPTFNNGTGDREMIYADGATLPAQAIKTGQLVEVVWDPARSKWATFLVPASQFAGTVTGAQLSLTGQQQGSMAVYGSSGWYAGAVGTQQQFWRGGLNPSWATPTGLPGQAKLACRVGASATLAQISGTGYTAVASTYGTGLYRLVFTPELPATFIPQLTFQGPTQRMVHIVSAVAGQIEFRVATTIVVPGGQNSVESNTINNGVGGAATNLGGSDFVHVVIF